MGEKYIWRAQEVEVGLVSGVTWHHAEKGPALHLTLCCCHVDILSAF